MGAGPISAPTFSTGYLERRSLLVGATLPIFIQHPFGKTWPKDPVSWTTSDDTIASVRARESSHEIVGLRPGAVTVRGTQGTHECVETLHVVDPANVLSVGLDLDETNTQAPNRFRLVATAFYEHRCWQVITADAEIVWTSSDVSIARVEASGIVLAQRDGDATVSIAFKGCSAHLDVHIEDGVLATFARPVFHESFVRVGLTTSISPSFFATVQDWRARPGTVSVSAEPPGMIEFNHVEGRRWTWRGLRSGAATIVLGLGTHRASKAIEVREAKNPRFLQIGVEAADDRSRSNLLFIGQESAAYVYLEDDYGSIHDCHDIVWSSSAPEVLSVRSSEDGVQVKAFAAGNATVRVECKPLGVSQERELRIAEEPHIEWF